MTDEFITAMIEEHKEAAEQARKWAEGYRTLTDAAPYFWEESWNMDRVEALTELLQLREERQAMSRCERVTSSRLTLKK